MERVRVEKLVYGGAGLGRIDGRVTLVPFVLPGEEVIVEAGRETPGMVEARLVEVIEASPERIEPRCPYFARCGGCHYQHTGYAFQLAQKRAILEEALRRTGKFEPPAEIAVVSGDPWNYRNRSQFHLERGRIGYLEAGSHRLCPVEQCPISSPLLNTALASLQEMMRDRRFPRFVNAIELFTNETDVQVNVLEKSAGVSKQFFEWCAERIPGATAGTLDYRAAGEVYRVGHRSFFQVNRFLVDALVQTALAGAEGISALDLYAGVGLFSVPLARRFRVVTAVESGSSALRDLDFNAARAGVVIMSVRDAADTFLGRIEIVPDFVLADPPRAGLGRRVVERLVALRPQRLVIVSCDPATLARDLAGLLAGGFAIERMTMVDLFPQTYHIETVTVLIPRS